MKSPSPNTRKTEYFPCQTISIVNTHKAHIFISLRMFAFLPVAASFCFYINLMWLLFFAFWFSSQKLSTKLPPQKSHLNILLLFPMEKLYVFPLGLHIKVEYLCPIAHLHRFLIKWENVHRRSYLRWMRQITINFNNMAHAFAAECNKMTNAHGNARKRLLNASNRSLCNKIKTIVSDRNSNLIARQLFV